MDYGDAPRGVVPAPSSAKKHSFSDALALQAIAQARDVLIPLPYRGTQGGNKCNIND